MKKAKKKKKVYPELGKDRIEWLDQDIQNKEVSEYKPWLLIHVTFYISINSLCLYLHE